MTSAKLVLDQITHKYGDGESSLTVLNKVSLQVEPGELVAIIGPSGSGKSTFLSIAGALLTPTQGKVYVDGIDLSGLGEQELTKLRLQQIGFIFQSANLIPYLRVQEQLMLVGKLAGMDNKDAAIRTQELLQRLGLSERSKYYPDKLSGGERQRVAIARAWMNDPAVMFADEPTASLDGSRGHDVVEMLATLVKKEGKAAVMVTHDERVLPLCDRVLNLENGVLTAG
ncbi:putative ABC transport system ATP-binding protein [Paenibacillus shirakamiensis]|uniref:Putative hemin import ATP-binding protein HrtA n=1 Tax=Paenibacillus shirakamiensis TaxID=1265935 RepID=A0ABS4JD97_9BACL|nr:ABC transporter ATP-binding protein [Paenibacillus shirakamiensis]MBP1999678.1 putative ABC transport system ATP-binding protein [Paenibacillus shirakamiensis]